MTALVKAQGGIIFEFCASTAVNLFGGLGLTKGGQGERVERLWRDCKIAAIPGSSYLMRKRVNRRWFRGSPFGFGDETTIENSEEERCKDLNFVRIEYTDNAMQFREC